MFVKAAISLTFLATVCCALRLKRDTRWNDGTVEGSEEPWKVPPPPPPGCARVECADIKCLAPLELKRTPEQCCPVCKGPFEMDNSYDSPFLVEPHAQAHENCINVRCFAMPWCVEENGLKTKFSPGDCCESCVKA
ncbi:unnamed protein product [Vitrella brassicaformis CCMP3155]|uniref:VWFC domain-containing protein n=2 Tax=Vitrella brassicaformis TaxID=1169539 RepID=A0A0G4G645_VITBC|nr:unnamed protein product [Vitrella brassicaformis CCMP3155]|mmetsp:Transcript_34020/g.84116  ORF Transcript_34020/g.84116 Transcript_34020/m.84116 type:complete len:136 (+) Transcript_34020:84-491(+)|eukprot:CEM24017.1 unnamed protein product [Vitrella brassicaformis CCMP3155]